MRAVQILELGSIDVTFELERTSEALLAVKHGRVRGKAVIVTGANR